GREEVWLGAGVPKSGLQWSANGQRLVFVGTDPADPAHSDIYEVGQGANAQIVPLTNSPGLKTGVMLAEAPGGAAARRQRGSCGRPPDRSRGGGRWWGRRRTWGCGTHDVHRRRSRDKGDTND